MYVSIGTAARLLGVCRKTLRRWEEKGRLFPKRTVGNHRRYKLSELNEFNYNDQIDPVIIPEKRCAAIYCRVSSAKQKADLL
ncbi:MAG: IS607 family transposase, partial [Promethearchaeota archaeon]